MTTLREAAQQALEAWDGGDVEWFKRAYTVMENLRAALAQREEPVSEDAHTTTLRNLLECCLSWEPDACVLGNVTARQAVAALRAALAQQDEPVQEQDVEDAIEAAYWHFDARKKGLNEWAYAPQSERDAFKAEARKLVRGYFPTRQAQDTKREMLAVADAFIRGKRSAQEQAEPEHETRAEIAEQRVVQLAEERDHYRNLWQKAQQAETVRCPASHVCDCQEAGQPCALAAPKPVQKPVAWLQPKTVDGYSRPDLGYETCSKDDYGAFPVHTSPPRRTMVPLTVKEIFDAFYAVKNATPISKRHGLSVLEIARLVEKASWEKNNGQA